MGEFFQQLGKAVATGCYRISKPGNGVKPAPASYNRVVTRRTLLPALAASTAALAQRGGPRRPNILFICTDQHSGGMLGANGHPIVRTPNLDRLAAGGVNFRHAYCGSPVCAPGRASMMTGRFASDVGSYCNSTPFDGRVPAWGNLLRDAGYHCWATGKLDLWKGRDFGFHEVATTHGHSQGPDITSLFRSPVCFRSSERKNANGEFYERPAPDLPLARHAIRFLREEAPALSKPWAMYVGLTKPHPKWHAPLKYRGLYPPEKMPMPEIPEGYLERRHEMFQVLANFKNVQAPVPEDRVRRARSAYFGMITEVDELIGTILSALDQSGQADNTLIVYTSDHGEMLGEHGLWLKNVLLEGAAHVPLILAGAGVPRGKVVDTPAMHADAVSTLLEAAGASRPRELRGHSLLTGGHPGFAYSESHSEGNCTGSFLIRKGDWKYLYFSGDHPLLFNLKDDPGEFRNLAGRKETAAVERELHAHLTSLVDPDAVSERAFADQEKFLRQWSEGMSKQDFYEELVGRLGPAQARAIANREYRHRA